MEPMLLAVNSSMTGPCFEENELVTYTIHGAHGVDFTEVTYFDVFLFFIFSSINISCFFMFHLDTW